MLACIAAATLTGAVGQSVSVEVYGASLGPVSTSCSEPLPVELEVTSEPGERGRFFAEGRGSLLVDAGTRP